MLIIQYRLDWAPDIGPWEDQIAVEVGRGTSDITLRMPTFGQSDRVQPATPVLYGANCLIDCQLHVKATRDPMTNRISLSDIYMDDFVFHYDAIFPGATVWTGHYQYWAVHDGVEDSIYDYYGHNPVINSYVTPIAYSMSVSTPFISEPQQFSNEAYYGRCYNHFNGNDLRVYVRCYNSYPKTYRPGACMHGGDWKTHDRDGGSCNVLKDGSWVEMRIMPGEVPEDPPHIRRSGNWVSQLKVGNY